jgi:hypothetical protein
MVRWLCLFCRVQLLARVQSISDEAKSGPPGCAAMLKIIIGL